MGDERTSDFSGYRRRELGLDHVSTRFSALQRAAEPERKEQAEQLDRATVRLRGAILSFFATRSPGTEYHGEDLRRHIAGLCGGAPDSARRVASELKNRYRLINYECIDRTKSLFRVLPVQPQSRRGP